jgi:hypothetical protein
MSLAAGIIVSVLMPKPTKWLETHSLRWNIAVLIFVSGILFFSINHLVAIYEGSKQQPAQIGYSSPVNPNIQGAPAQSNLNGLTPKPKNTSNRTASNLQEPSTEIPQAANSSANPPVQLATSASFPRPPIQNEIPANNIRSEVHLPYGIERKPGEIMAQFRVHLFKQDGWFDPGIPITDDLYLKTYRANTCAVPGGGKGAQIMVGKTIVYPSTDPKAQFYHLRSMDGENGHRVRNYSQEVIIPEKSIFHPLKVRILPLEGASEECDFFIIVILWSEGAQGEFSEVQQREEQALIKQAATLPAPEAQLPTPAVRQSAPAVRQTAPAVQRPAPMPSEYDQIKLISVRTESGYPVERGKPVPMVVTLAYTLASRDKAILSLSSAQFYDADHCVKAGYLIDAVEREVQKGSGTIAIHIIWSGDTGEHSKGRIFGHGWLSFMAMFWENNDTGDGPNRGERFGLFSLYQDYCAAF